MDNDAQISSPVRCREKSAESSVPSEEQYTYEELLERIEELSVAEEDAKDRCDILWLLCGLIYVQSAANGRPAPEVCISPRMCHGNRGTHYTTAWDEKDHCSASGEGFLVCGARRC